MGIEQNVAVVTGASQGIGAALVKAYRDRGCRVVATARSVKPQPDADILFVAGDIAGFFHITQLAIAQMEKQGSGHVVQITTSLVDHALAGVPAALAALT